MVDEEVETTLREIRERVRKAAELEPDLPRAGVPDEANLSPSDESSPQTPQTLARIDAYLTTTARAWDRLPPVVSNRSGGLARLELWIKRRLKKATRWYSWEQINFNAAVHHALRDTLDALKDLEQQMEHRLGQMLAEMNAEKEASARELEQIRREIATQRAQIESQRATFESQRAEFKAYRGQIEAEQHSRSVELNSLVRELRERDQHRLEEQRVCFKQLSLEMTEAEVLLDRARRDIESRLDKLESAKG